MSSTFRTRRRWRAATMIAATMLVGFCGIADLRAQQNMAVVPAHEPVAETTLFPGGGAMPPENPLAKK
jgi:hypothetical protein